MISRVIMSFSVYFVFLLLMCDTPIQNVIPDMSMNKNPEKTDLVKISQDLLHNIKYGKKTDSIVENLSLITYDQLKNQLSTDHQKLAFWINIYNAFIQISLSENPDAYQQRTKFFDKERIVIGGRVLSFSNIEHGIIRGSQWAYGLGRIKNPFAPAYHREWGPSYREPRIHFALNCGAKSCPPVTIYSAESLDSQLDFMTEKFLKANTKLLDSNTVETTVLFSWFRGDFGGKKGIKKMLLDYGVIKNKDAHLKFGDYDWSLFLDNFIDTY